MKRCFVFLLLLSPLIAYSQETSRKLNPDFRKNELRLNALLLLFEGMEFSYERALNYDCSVGGSSLILAYKDSDLESGMNYNVTAFGRYYFGKKPVSGFFLETFLMFFNRDNLIDYYDYNRSYSLRKIERETNVALGFGFGVKWIRRNFSFELSTGLGRVPRSAYNGYIPFVGRGAFGVGYRF